jgi:hypothetical protein
MIYITLLLFTALGIVVGVAGSLGLRAVAQRRGLNRHRKDMAKWGGDQC